MKNKNLKYFVLTMVCWSILVSALMLQELKQAKESINELVKIEAKANFNKDLAIRHWAALHGGVYVPVDSLTPPNPGLAHIPDRDITKPDGTVLTLMNPAYMIRQLNEFFTKSYGIVGHITSTKLIRPENVPDEWEKNALEQFEHGVKEVSEFTEINGEKYLRLMQPMITEESCLKCHGFQGYKEGDIRGGVSVSVPMSVYDIQAQSHKNRTLKNYFIIWFIGLVGFAVIFYRLAKINAKRELAESDLQKRNEQLESTTKILYEKNEALEIARKQAEQSDKLKTEFLNNMSHEIRTPMNGIVGFTEFLTQPNITEKEKTEYSHIIRKSTSQLLRIIDDILEMSLLEKGHAQISKENFNLNKLLSDIISEFNKNRDEKGVALVQRNGVADTDCQLFSDKEVVTKIINQLVENALKFTEAGHVELGYFEKDGHLEIYVKDTGIGIHPDNFEQIFERFSQEDKELSRKVGGLGIGLSIAQKLAQTLEGEINLMSESGEGSTFTLVLPVTLVQDDNQNATLNYSVDSIEAGKKVTVLIAEDEEINYLYLETILLEKEDINWEILHARNGQQAIDMVLENSDVDLILMDLKMPVLDGYEATRKIKSIKPDLPIVVQTAHSVSTEKAKAFETGCDDLITKPIDEDEFFDIVMGILLPNEKTSNSSKF